MTMMMTTAMMIVTLFLVVTVALLNALTYQLGTMKLLQGDCLKLFKAVNNLSYTHKQVTNTADLRTKLPRIM